LEALELDDVKLNDTSEGSIKWDLKSRKIKWIKMNKSAAEIESLLESLEKCVIEEAELDYTLAMEIIEKFLKSQEKNLKKLTIKTGFNVSNLKDLRLEYLDFYHYGLIENISLEFLREQTDLKILKMLVAKYSKKDLSMICELK
jgi:hypothetical protein